jgi:hypothetical protein
LIIDQPVAVSIESVTADIDWLGSLLSDATCFASYTPDDSRLADSEGRRTWWSSVAEFEWEIIVDHSVAVVIDSVAGLRRRDAVPVAGPLASDAEHLAELILAVSTMSPTHREVVSDAVAVIVLLVTDFVLW